MRLFFALWPTEEIRRDLQCRAERVEWGPGTRRVPAESLHVTVAFVGEVAAPAIKPGSSDTTMSPWDPLRQIGRTQHGSACKISFDHCEHWREPQVVAAVTRCTPQELAELCARLHEDLARIFPGDARFHNPRPLRAHVTLARKVAQAPVLKEMPPIEWDVTSLSLVKSQTGGAHSIYTVLDTWPLLYETPNP